MVDKREVGGWKPGSMFAKPFVNAAEVEQHLKSLRLEVPGDCYQMGARNPAGRNVIDGLLHHKRCARKLFFQFRYDISGYNIFSNCRQLLSPFYN
jgi:hypothetical protein